MMWIKKSLTEKLITQFIRNLFMIKVYYCQNKLELLDYPPLELPITNNFFLCNILQL
jgi:hypothetical protein